MAKTRDNYQVSGNTPAEIVRDLNFKLQRLADRMDKMEGIRGTASIESDLDMNSNLITEVGGGSLDDDAARLADLTVDIGAAINAHEAEADPHTQYAQNAEAEVINGAWSFSSVVTANGGLKVFDANGVLIHSMELA